MVDVEAVVGGLGGDPALGVPLLQELVDLALHRRVPVVLDGVVGAPRQLFRYFRPPVPEPLVGFENGAVFEVGPGCLGNVRVQVVVPVLIMVYGWVKRVQHMQ